MCEVIERNAAIRLPAWRAEVWKDGSHLLMYAAVSVSGIQPTITGELVDVGAGTTAWSGVRGGHCSQEIVERAADLLNCDGWQLLGSDDAGACYAPAEHHLVGTWIDTHERQPDDAYWQPRTIRAESMGAVEWFSNIGSARMWIMAHAAITLVS